MIATSWSEQCSSPNASSTAPTSETVGSGNNALTRSHCSGSFFVLSELVSESLLTSAASQACQQKTWSRISGNPNSHTHRKHLGEELLHELKELAVVRVLEELLRQLRRYRKRGDIESSAMISPSLARMQDGWKTLPIWASLRCADLSQASMRSHPPMFGEPKDSTILSNLHVLMQGAGSRGPQ